MQDGMDSVSSMSVCDTAAWLDSKIAVILARIQRLRVLYTYGLAVYDGDRDDEKSNRLSPADALMKANVIKTNEWRIRTFE